MGLAFLWIMNGTFHKNLKLTKLESLHKNRKVVKHRFIILSNILFELMY